MQRRRRDAKTGPGSEAIARKNSVARQCPVLPRVGGLDDRIAANEPFHDLALAMGKPVRMRISANGDHDFVMGSTFDARERTVAFIKKPKPQ